MRQAAAKCASISPVQREGAPTCFGAHDGDRRSRRPSRPQIGAGWFPVATGNESAFGKGIQAASAADAGGEQGQPPSSLTPVQKSSGTRADKHNKSNKKGEATGSWTRRRMEAEAFERRLHLGSRFILILLLRACSPASLRSSNSTSACSAPRLLPLLHPCAPFDSEAHVHALSV